MFAHSSYRTPLLIGIRHRWLTVAVLFAVPIAVTFVLAFWMPETWLLMLKWGFGLGLGLALLMSAFLFLSNRTVVGPSRLIRKGILGGSHQLEFHEVSFIVTVPAAAATSTTVMSGDPFDTYGHMVAEMGKGLLLLADRIKSTPKIFHARTKNVIGISSYTERYPELLAEVVRKSPNALVDPFSRMIAGFADLPVSYDESSSRSREFYQDYSASARAHLRRFELYEARRDFMHLPREQLSVQDLHLLGQIELLTKYPEQAREYLEAASSQSPNNPDIRAHLGLAYYCAGDPASARREFLASDKLRPLGPSETALLGCSEVRMRNWDVAANIFRRMEMRAAASCSEGVAGQCAACAAKLSYLSRNWGSPEVKKKTQTLGYVLGALGVLSYILAHVAEDRGWIGYPVMAIILAGAAYLKHQLSQRIGLDDIANYPACWMDMGWTGMGRDVNVMAGPIEEVEEAEIGYEFESEVGEREYDEISGR